MDGAVRTMIESARRWTLVGRIDGQCGIVGPADIRWPRVNNKRNCIMILIQYLSDPTNSGQICNTVALADVQWLTRSSFLARRVVAVSTMFPLIWRTRQPPASDASSPTPWTGCAGSNRTLPRCAWLTGPAVWHDCMLICCLYRSVM